MGAPTHASACFHQESARNLLQYCFIWAAAYIRECVAGMGFWEWARRSLSHCARQKRRAQRGVDLYGTTYVG
jgi:hypothetical protein